VALLLFSLDQQVSSSPDPMINSKKPDGFQQKKIKKKPDSRQTYNIAVIITLDADMQGNTSPSYCSSVTIKTQNVAHITIGSSECAQQFALSYLCTYAYWHIIYFRNIVHIPIFASLHVNTHYE
jgi:hypothetical protein